MALKKLKYFEYFLSKLYSKTGNGDANDLSILKVLKLLFFTTAVDSSESKDSVLIKNVFNNFVAMPYGHVESTVYSAIRSNSLSYFLVDSMKTTMKAGIPDFSDLDIELKRSIDVSIDSLSNENPFILSENAFNLVEISHQYLSWKKYYAEGKKSGIYSFPIPPEEIIKEKKFYRLNQFELF